MYSNMRPTGIKVWIPKQRFNNATQILPARKRLTLMYKIGPAPLEMTMRSVRPNK